MGRNEGYPVACDSSLFVCFDVLQGTKFLLFYITLFLEGRRKDFYFIFQISSLYFSFQD